MRTTIAALLLGCLGLAACSPPEPPDEERRPEPKAADAPRPPSAIVRAADAYKGAARAAVANSEQAAANEKAALDAATQ